MKIYIAGKITGVNEAEARAVFAEASRAIAARGHEPLNPMELVDQTPGRSYLAYFIDALRVVDEQAEAMFMLPNWPLSFGANVEHGLAICHLHLPVYYSIDEVPGT